MDFVKKFGIGLAIGCALGLIFKAFLGTSWMSAFSFVVFYFVTDIILETLEHDNATKRTLKRMSVYALGAIAFIGLRMWLGYMFDMPLIDSIKAAQNGPGIFGSTYKPVPVNLMLELLFVVPGGVFSYMLIKGGKVARGFCVMFSLLCLISFLWAVKQPTHTAALKRTTQGSIDVKAREYNNNGLKKEAAAAISFGIAKTNVIPYTTDDEENEDIKALTKIEDLTIDKGEMVMQTNPNQTGIVYQGIIFVPVRLRNTDGTFIDGKEVLVEAMLFDWADGSSALPNKYFIKKSDNGEFWKVTFLTDCLIDLPFELKLRQRYMIAGANEAELFESSVRTGELEKVPLGVVRKNNTRNSLAYKYKAGETITIRFFNEKSGREENK